ncbi:MAG: hypothetical protein Kow0099_10060 [Candidatus Abyssubacteria bacterium]
MRFIWLLAELLALAVTLSVTMTYVIRTYEIGNGDSSKAAYGAFSAFDRILAIVGEIAAAFACILLYPLGSVMGKYPKAGLRPGERPVILCHGYKHNRSGFLLMRHRLKRAGWNNVITPNFRPASATVPHFAEQLAETVQSAISETAVERVDLIGHSMGGLVIRYYLDRLGGAAHVRTAITLGSPHGGTKMAALGLFKSARQFRTDSQLIRELNLSSPSEAVRMLAIWSEFDNIVLPPQNALLPAPYENFMVGNVGHIALLFSGRVFDKIARTLSEGKC